jgi:NAD(P)H-flavin reductase
VVNAAAPTGFLPRADLGRLLDVLRDDGRRVIGPTVADGAIVYDEISGASDLPIGWGARQAPGTYRLERRDDERAFDYAVGPTAWKRFTFPPVVPISVAKRTGVGGRGVTFDRAKADPRTEVRPLAFFGVRACEIAALLVQDRVFLGGPATDDDYRARRAAALVIAVECTTAADTCFCSSMGTGPEVTDGFDLALTELDDGFVVRTGSPAGEALAARLELAVAAAERVAAATAAVATVRARIGRPVAADGLPARLLGALDSPRWAEVAQRCLACANCTLVCPTCFCTSVGQVSDLDGVESVSERRWDSCFTAGFGQVAGGNFRPRVQDRYRQWLTHKFATWTEQFGTSGCVGCGRCITWCPVGIDVRAELLAIAPPTLAPGAVVTTPLAVGAAPRPAAVVAWPTAGLDRPTPHPTGVAPAEPAHDLLRQAYLPVRVVETHRETSDTMTLHLETDDPTLLAGLPGQFVMAQLPGFPAAPISVSRFRPDGLELTIRAAGPATATITALRRGDELGLRGPLGRGWPVEAGHGRDVAVVTGGIGLAPLRPLIDALLAQRDRFGTIRIFYGARTTRDLLYGGELDAWARRGDVELALTVDRAGPEWLGRVGIVTHLFDRAPWDGSQSVAYVCGPERMMQATADTLATRGLIPERIFVTLERHMDCGVGLCGHCQMGRFFVCRDGPVTSLAELGDTFGREGI